MGDRNEAIDETVFNKPEYAQYFAGINEHTVLYYFAESQFFDETSNNAALMTQANYNQSMAHIRESRQAFEGVLRTMSGLEFVLANESPIPEGNDVWIIKKQNRQKMRGSEVEDVVTVLATYYIVGESIYMAPLIGNVLQSKLLSMTTSLNNLFSSISSLSRFLPALGHTYFGPTLKLRKFPSNTQSSQLSKRSFSLSDGQEQTREVNTAQAQVTTNLTNSNTRILSESFRSFLQYHNEFMDENPLRGEPGSFVLSSTKEHLQQTASQKVQPARMQTDIKNSAMLQDLPSTNLQSEIEPASIRKGSREHENAPSSSDARPKAKRRKSRVAQSPTISG